MNKKDLRRKVLEIHYELSDGNSWNHVLRPEVGKRLGIDYNGNELLGAIKYLEDKGFLKSATNVEDGITVYGIDEVEDGYPTLGKPTDQSNNSTALIETLHQIDEALELGEKGLLRLEECSDIETTVKENIKSSLVEGSVKWREFDKARRQTRYKTVTTDGYLSPKDLGELKFWKKFIKEILGEGDKQEAAPTKVSTQRTEKFDVFICHASEDKKFVANLAEELKNSGFEVWYDDFQVGWGDDLRPAIDNGLKNSSYGLVVFSKSFLGKKKWTEYELNGLFSKEKQGKKVILPIWHDIDRSDLEKYSPTFADRIALKSSSLNEILAELKKLLND